jgi:cytidine deaminase
MTLAMTNIAERLIDLLAVSYCPYSNFKVSCIIKDKNGKLYDGVNVENSSYGLTICAERSAICNMIASGSKQISAIYLAR